MTSIRNLIAHLHAMQAGVTAAHLGWRINKPGIVPSYLPEFKCVMDQGGGRGLYMYSQWMSDGDVLDIVEGAEPHDSKIAFEEMFYAKRGDIGNLHHEMMK